MKDFAMIAIPGFLGLPNDWESLFQQNPFTAIKAVSLFTDNLAMGLWEWGEWLNEQCASMKNKVLLGYSLGGRLAMHALIKDPSAWQAAIVISAHPGLKTAEEKKQRVLLDRQWSYRFENETWDQLMQEWNTRTVFQKDQFFFERYEENYTRASLSQALWDWSLGKQEDLQPQIETVDRPILWITGAEDSLYSSLAKSLQFKHPLSQIVAVPHAGHRVPWQAPTIFHQHINQFLKKVIEWKQ